MNLYRDAAVAGRLGGDVCGWDMGTNEEMLIRERASSRLGWL